MSMAITEDEVKTRENSNDVHICHLVCRKCYPGFDLIVALCDQDVTNDPQDLTNRYDKCVVCVDLALTHRCKKDE